MAGTTNYAGIVKWAQLDLQRIQHRDYVGHLSIYFLTVSIFESHFQKAFARSLSLVFSYLTCPHQATVP